MSLSLCVCVCLKPLSLEDLARLPLDQRRRRLQEKIDDMQKELQRETEQRYITVSLSTELPQIMQTMIFLETEITTKNIAIHLNAGVNPLNYHFTVIYRYTSGVHYFSNNSTDRSQLFRLYYGCHTSRHRSDDIFQGIRLVFLLTDSANQLKTKLCRYNV